MRVICARPDIGKTVRVRAAVLDLDIVDARHDVLLAPAHSLPPDPAQIARDCYVVTSDGARLTIDRHWLSAAPLRSHRDDWAVLMTHETLGNAAGRLRPGRLPPATLSGLAEDQSTVDVLLVRPDADLQACRILALREPSVFEHSCRAWAGLSGSPVVVGHDNEPVIIGINIGQMIRPVDFDGPLFISVALAINDEIADAIQAAAAAAR